MAIYAFISLTLLAGGCMAEFGEKTLVIHPRFYYQNGPNSALGAIIYSPGWGGADAQKKGMADYVSGLYGRGWDVYFHDRNTLDTITNVETNARQLRNAIHGLNRARYKKVVILGQSDGAYNALVAANDSSTRLHAIVIHGSSPTAKWATSGLRTFYEALEQAKAQRFMVFQFRNDGVVPTRPKEKVDKILASKNVPYIHVFQPQGLPGHWGAFRPNFPARYEHCIFTFIDPRREASGSECR